MGVFHVADSRTEHLLSPLTISPRDGFLIDLDVSEELEQVRVDPGPLAEVPDRLQWAIRRQDGHTGRKATAMATQADVRRIALSLPQTEEAADRFAFSVRNKGKLKGFVWVWMERIEPKKPRVPQPDVVAVRVASLTEKDRLLALAPTKFFTEPHYDGFPAVLVNLPAVAVRELEPLIKEAWRCQAPKDLNA
jgi:hypothetical protein